MTDDPVLNAAPADEPEKTEPSPRDLWTQRGHEIITDVTKRSTGARPEAIIAAVLHALFSHMSQSPDEYAAHLKALADAAALEEKRRQDAADKAAAETKARADAALAAAEHPAPMATDPDYRTAEQREADRQGQQVRPPQPQSAPPPQF